MLILLCLIILNTLKQVKPPNTSFKVQLLLLQMPLLHSPVNKTMGLWEM